MKLSIELDAGIKRWYDFDISDIDEGLCWKVQVVGVKSCDGCENNGTDGCNGLSLISAKKNSKGNIIPLGKLCSVWDNKQMEYKNKI